jgi:uncharacterized SAM-binding protein YcdF (DUF218 family)
MFVFLSKLLPPLIYPVGLIAILIAAAILFRKRARLQIVLLIIALGLILIGGNRYVAAAVIRSLEDRIHAPAQFEPAEAIVVLGGGTEAQAPPRRTVEITGAGDRVLYAAKLYRDSLAPIVLASGGNITWLSNRPSSPAEEMAALLEFVGVPRSAIWLQDQSQNTYEDALYSAEMLKEKGISRIILVTSAMHMPRSYALFTAQGLEVIPAPTDFYVPDYYWADPTQGEFTSVLVNLIPSAASLANLTSCLKEYLGLLIYRLQGWI